MTHHTVMTETQRASFGRSTVWRNFITALCMNAWVCSRIMRIMILRNLAQLLTQCTKTSPSTDKTLKLSFNYLWVNLSVNLFRKKKKKYLVTPRVGALSGKKETHPRWPPREHFYLRESWQNRGEQRLYLEFGEPFFDDTSLWTQHLPQRPLLGCLMDGDVTEEE